MTEMGAGISTQGDHVNIYLGDILSDTTVSHTRGIVLFRPTLTSSLG